MRQIEVIGTGGTIASRQGNSNGGAVAADGIQSLLGNVPTGVTISTRDLFTMGSYQIGPRELRQIAITVADAAKRPEVDGIVVSHGTDTIEESAFLVDLVHDSSKPVIFTGAQRAADQADTDGPRNLFEAVEAAADPQMAGIGSAVAFAGELFPSRGIRKGQTLTPVAFIHEAKLAVHHPRGWIRSLTPRRSPALPLPSEAFERRRVELFSAAPGTDPEMIHREIAVGVDGIVLIGTGAGNAGPGYLAMVQEATSRGIPVVLATRVPGGPVAGMYGNGGGADLLRAGAISANGLSPYQARILLALLLDQATATDQIRTQFDQLSY